MDSLNGKENDKMTSHALLKDVGLCVRHVGHGCMLLHLRDRYVCLCANRKFVLTEMTDGA